MAHSANKWLFFLLQPRKSLFRIFILFFLHANEVRERYQTGVHTHTHTKMTHLYVGMSLKLSSFPKLNQLFHPLLCCQHEPRKQSGCWWEIILLGIQLAYIDFIHSSKMKCFAKGTHECFITRDLIGRGCMDSSTHLFFKFCINAFYFQL